MLLFVFVGCPGACRLVGFGLCGVLVRRGVYSLKILLYYAVELFLDAFQEALKGAVNIVFHLLRLLFQVAYILNGAIRALEKNTAGYYAGIEVKICSTASAALYSAASDETAVNGAGAVGQRNKAGGVASVLVVAYAVKHADEEIIDAGGFLAFVGRGAKKPGAVASLAGADCVNIIGRRSI